jgi:hypothetical protein
LGSPAHGRVVRNRAYIVITFLVIVALSAWLLAEINIIAEQRAKAHKHSFYEYVVTHHIGKLEEIDDGTGLNPLSYVLTLDHNVSNTQLQSYVYDLIHRYVAYDHGQTLTVMVATASSGHPIQIAQAHYDDDEDVLTLHLTPLDGHWRTVVFKQLKW